MKIRSCADPYRVGGAHCLLTSLFFLLGAAGPAVAEWTAADAQTAFSNYNNAFYFNPSGNNYDYRSSQGSTNTSGFWVGAEEIELAIDAYNQNPTTANSNIINQLCNGFVAQFGSDWSSDSFDDDLMWATIAFVRAYGATGNTAWLNDAETNFAVVWSRGYDTTFGGGIWWNSAAEGLSAGFKNSAANWTFVIAGNLLYKATNNLTYLNEANTIFKWASSNLYNASNGQVYDGINSSGIQNGNYSYNYGVAAGADYFENRWSDATNVATYLITNLSSGIVGGYNILPNYGQGGTDGSGFNGIALRWIGYAYVHGAIANRGVLSWAQTNVGLAWAGRNSSGLSWNNWLSFTPNGGQYSWDCSNTVVGMLDIPNASSAADFSLTSSSAVLDLTPGSSGSAAIAFAQSNGFTGTVDLSATLIGSPAGVSASLSQTSIAHPGTTTLTVSTTSATPGGNYLIGITGISGAIGHTIYVQLALPYFTLSANPNSIYLNQGGTATINIVITPQNGFNGKVQFLCPAGLPQGVTASFLADSASTGTALQLTASVNAATGIDTPLSITATSGALTQTLSSGTLTVSAAIGNWSWAGGMPVDLSAAYNGTGIYPEGATYAKSAGLDGDGFSYSSDLLTNARALSGIAFKFGPAGNPDVVHGTGQTIPLPPGAFTTLQLLATGIGGEQSGQTLVVTYTDGTTAQFTQSFSDWFSSSNNANETVAVVMPYRNYADGTQDNRPFTLYAYTFILNSGKTVKSVTLPNNGNVVVLAARLARQYLGDQVDLSSAFNVEGIYTDGTAFPSNGGLDGGGTAYSANLLGIQSGSSNLIVDGVNFSLGAPNVNNALYGTGQPIALPAGHFTSLRILGTGVQGAQTSQTVAVVYTDGTTMNFTQSFSDWFSPQAFPRESVAQKMAYRNRSDGTKDSQTFNIYQYAFPLDREKTVKSLTLPTNRHVVVLGITLAKDLFDVGGEPGCVLP